jgi:hypothetical protein
MKRQMISRIISLFLLSLLTAWAFHNSRLKNHAIGRDSYLAHQSTLYAKDFTKPPAVFPDVVKCLVGSGFAFGSYEILTFCILVVTKKVSRADGNAPSP